MHPYRGKPRLTAPGGPGQSPDKTASDALPDQCLPRVTAISFGSPDMTPAVPHSPAPAATPGLHCLTSLSSGTPITAALPTLGWRLRTSSTSVVDVEDRRVARSGGPPELARAPRCRVHMAVPRWSRAGSLLLTPLRTSGCRRARGSRRKCHATDRWLPLPRTHHRSSS